MTSVDEANGWYGGTLLGDQDESSEIYKFYAELCQVKWTFPLSNNIQAGCFLTNNHLCFSLKVIC